MKQNKNMKTLIAISATILLLAIGGFLLYSSLSSNKTGEQNGDSSTYTGPTDQEVKDADNHKDELVKQMQEEAKKDNDDASKKTVTPVITYAAQEGDTIVVTAYIQGIFEDSGTCTLKATKGNTIISKDNEAFANASTTDCKPFRVKRSEFTSGGEWLLSLRYNSTQSEGTSKEITVEVK